MNLNNYHCREKNEVVFYVNLGGSFFIFTYIELTITINIWHCSAVAEFVNETKPPFHLQRNLFIEVTDK